MKPQIENLKKKMLGAELNSYQQGLALDEFYKLLDYLAELEQLRQPLVSGSLPLDKLRQKLDEALAKETPETLIKWLEEKRQ